MLSNFANELQKFSQAIDIVDSRTMEKVHDMITQHFSGFFPYMEFLLLEVQEDEPYLRTAWWSLNSDFDRYSLPRNGLPAGQVPNCVIAEVPAWIHSKSGQPCLESDEFIDHWSGLDNIPAYLQSPHDFQVKTSIVIPVKEDREVIGVMNFESDREIPHSKSGEETFRKITEALSTLIANSNSYRRQSDCTRRALRNLNELASVETDFEIPTIFVASAANCDEMVESKIIATVKEFAPGFSVVSWRDLSQTGLIDSLIQSAIAQCEFGICYLSEKYSKRNGTTGFRDNLNVLFEGGMMQGLSLDASTPIKDWVPIREEEPAKYFDLAHIRTLVVSRDADKNPKLDALAQELQLILSKWLRDAG